jgi:2'-5' RNA ligase
MKEEPENSSAENVSQAVSEGKKTSMRSVLIFPHFADTAAIDHVRSMFDPAFTKIEPHITLVFPFSSIYTADEIRDEVVSCAAGIRKFKLTLCETVVKDSFLFMIPSEGRDNVTALFRNLHAGLFKPFLPPVLEQEEFIPHMTIGTCTSENAQERLVAARSLLSEYTALIDTVSVEIIGPDSKAIIESEILLMP